jgi:hypothetical protein
VTGIRKVDLNPEFGYDVSEDSSDAAGSRGSGESAAGQDIAVEPGRDEVSVAVAVVYELGA